MILINSKPSWNCTTWIFIKRYIYAQVSEVEDDGEEKHRLRNFDARNERIETGAVVTNRRGQRGKERGQGECYHWKAKG